MTSVKNPQGPDKAGVTGNPLDGTDARKGSAAPADSAAPIQPRDASLAPAPSDQPASPRRDFKTAIELIEKASEAIDSLQARCRQLEQEGQESRERSKLEVEAAESLAAEWLKLARATKAQLEDCETRLALTKQEADAAEARAELAEERLKSVQHLATQEAEQFARIHDKIVSAFGVGSRAHGALDALGG